MELHFDGHGQVRCLYGEEISLAELGAMHIERASHVEPEEQGQWWVDLQPVQGPRLGPFGHRSQALAAEHDWLIQHWLDS